jgi:capsular polysaccharide transport system permease protein
MSELSSAETSRPVLQSRPRRSFASARVIIALMLREMATTYGRSPLGYLWAVMEPVAGIAVLTAVFTVFIRTPPLGTNFAIFYATGMIPFMLYSDISGKMLAALAFSRQLLVYPSVTYVDALLGRFFLNILTQILVAYIVFSGILMIFDTRTVINLPAIGLSLAMAAAFAFGVGTVNCFLAGVMPSYPRIWAITNRPLFLISCVFFLWDTIPLPYRDWLWYNPLVHIVAEMRRGFYPYYEANYVSVTYVFGVSLFLWVLGLIFLGRFSRFILNN